MNTESSPQSFVNLITELINGQCRPTDLENIELAIAWEPLDVVFNQDRECASPLSDSAIEQWGHLFFQAETAAEIKQAELEAHGLDLQALRPLWIQLNQERLERQKTQKPLQATKAR